MGQRADATYDQTRPFTDRDGTFHPQGVTREVTTSATSVTLDADDSGKVIIITGDDQTVTLPATESGLEYIIMVGGTSTSVGLSVAPNAADQIIGNGFTAADDKDAINTQATERVGDTIHLIGDGSAGWYIVNVHGTWAREA